MRQRKGFYLLWGIIFLFGLYLLSPLDAASSTPPPANPEATTQNEVVYQGVEGQDALTLLKASHSVETKKYDFGEMVTSIDAVAGDNNHFWAFYINGEPATVGAGDYKTKSGDTISWRLEPILVE